MSAYLQLKSTKRGFVYGLILISIIRCQEPIEFSFPSSEAKLVVDGFITDVEKKHQIRLSFSSGINEDGVDNQIPIDNAEVVITSHSGLNIDLINEQNGTYYTPPFKALVGESYKLTVTLVDEVYTSTFQALPNFSTTAQVTYELDTRQILSTKGEIIDQMGIGIFAEIAPTTETVYYHWLQRNYFIWEAANADGTNFPNEYCYVRGNDRSQVDLLKAVIDPLGSPSLVQLDFIPASPLFEHEFAVEVIQLITNQESYQYWSSVKSQFENVGSQFDVVPSSIDGNISNSKGERVLGFFGVYNESNQRLFFDNQDSGLPLAAQEESTICLPIQFFPQDPCYDCLFADGLWSQLEAPDWWRDHTIEDDDDIGTNRGLFGTWSLETQIMSGCTDPSLNGQTNQTCDFSNCVKLTLNEDMTFQKVVKSGGSVTSSGGVYLINGETLALLDTKTEVTSIFRFNNTSSSLTLIYQNAGCLVEDVYDK